MVPSVSIITPVYKSASFIDRYIGLVMAQTLSDIEVLIVDDHGEDGSIAHAHSITDPYCGPIRFRYLSTPTNSGPGAARNVGINAAAGKYVAFVDVDDWIDPQFCELLFQSAERNGSDLCCCSIDIFDSGDQLLSTRNCPLIADGEFIGQMRKKFLYRYVSYFTTYLYRRNLFEEYHIHFPSNRSSEDTAMLCCALLNCERISVVDRSLYRYVRKDDSLSSSVDNERYLHRLASMGELMETVRREGWYAPYKDELDFIYFKKGYLMAVFDYVANSEKIRKSDLKETREELLRQVPDYEKNKYLRKSLLFHSLDVLVREMPLVATPIIRTYMRKFNRSIL